MLMFDGLDGVCSGLPGPDPNRLLDRRYKNLAIADPAGLGCLSDRLDRPFDTVIREHDLELHLREEVDDVLGTTIEFGMALLTPEPLRFDDGDTLQPDILKGLLYLVELEGFDDRFDLFHGKP